MGAACDCDRDAAAKKAGGNKEYQDRHDPKHAPQTEQVDPAESNELQQAAGGAANAHASMFNNLWDPNQQQQSRPQLNPQATALQQPQPQPQTQPQTQTQTQSQQHQEPPAAPQPQQTGQHASNGDISKTARPAARPSGNCFPLSGEG